MSENKTYGEERAFLDRMRHRYSKMIGMDYRTMREVPGFGDFLREVVEPAHMKGIAIQAKLSDVMARLFLHRALAEQGGRAVVVATSASVWSHLSNEGALEVMHGPMGMFLWKGGWVPVLVEPSLGESEGLILTMSRIVYLDFEALWQ